MSYRIARCLLLFIFGAFGLGLVDGPVGKVAALPPALQTAEERGGRTVLVGGDLSFDNLLWFTTTAAASGRNDLVLLDTLRFSTYAREFLEAYHADRIVPVGPFPRTSADLEQRWKFKAAEPVSWDYGMPRELWKVLFPRAQQVVVCPLEPRPRLLQAACLAGALKAPLFITHDRPTDADNLREWMARWQTREVFAVGEAKKICSDLPQVHIKALQGQGEVIDAYLRQLSRQGPISTLVITNPEDIGQGKGAMSALAPWLAIQHRAALLLTDAAGADVEATVRAAMSDRRLQSVESVILAATLEAIPMKQRPNPIPADKDPHIELEPLTPTGNEPFSFAVGRIFHDDIAVVMLQMARQRLMAESRGPRRALVASNPGGSLPLLETFSRHTAHELANAGYRTTALFNHDVTKDDLRRLLPEFDIILWEGHHNTLIKDWEMPDWDEPMQPSLVFLQSCLALMESKAQPLIQRGAVAVIGTSTRTYSASGGATSLAFFDALLYEDQTMGGALRQAKNFLLAYTMLKEKRLGAEAKRSGANQRAAWAFTLWGDPTFRPPLPKRADEPSPRVTHEIHGNTIVVHVPPQTYDAVTTRKYQAELAPNVRMAGLVHKETDDKSQSLVPLLFTEVHLPRALAGATPTLHGKLPSSHYVFCWDARRRSGYLLIEPRALEEQELRFHVEWK